MTHTLNLIIFVHDYINIIEQRVSNRSIFFDFNLLYQCLYSCDIVIDFKLNMVEKLLTLTAYLQRASKVHPSFFLNILSFLCLLKKLLALVLPIFIFLISFVILF